MRPAAIATPAIDRALMELKKPPMLQPNAMAAPIPINVPPMSALKSSNGGAPCMRNCRARRAAAHAPATTPKFRRDVEYRYGGMIVLLAISSELNSQSPQFLTPSAALQGFSYANIMILVSASNMPPIHAAHWPPKTAAWPSLKADPKV